MQGTTDWTGMPPLLHPFLNEWPTRASPGTEIFCTEIQLSWIQGCEGHYLCTAIYEGFFSP